MQALNLAILNRKKILTHLYIFKNPYLRIIRSFGFLWAQGRKRHQKKIDVLFANPQRKKADTAHFYFVRISYFSLTQSFCSTCQKASRMGFIAFFSPHRYSLTMNLGAFVLRKGKCLLYAFRDLHAQAL